MNTIWLSNSAIDKYNLCPKLFKYRYIDRINSKLRTSALVFGSALDEAVESLIHGKSLMESQDIFLQYMLENFSKDLHTYKKDLDWNSLTQEDIEHLNSIEENTDLWTNTYAKRSLISKGLGLIELFNESFLPRITEVLSTQLKIQIKNGKYTIVGYVDMIVRLDDDKVYLLDLKSSSSSYPMSKLNNSGQLHLYDFALGLMKKRGDFKGELPEEIGYVVLRKDSNTKGKLRPVQFISKIPDEKIKLDIMKNFGNLITDIEEANFPETDQKFNCTKQFGKKCEYYDLCKLNKPLSEIPHLYKKGEK